MLFLDYSFLLLICLISNFSNFTENHEIECNVFVFQIGVSMCVCVCVGHTQKHPLERMEIVGVWY